ncbi:MULTISPECIES: MFS transporter [Chromobacterium]|uniref:MFS transporter n=1 Tax=Chromobacterium aquaticum TaxID=467180 RepID=A0ABV8ZQ73_9NEIS|nr:MULTISPECIES: MFS transporter [Chromobacterium]MCD5363613.1 MFS transporter [Chromobacterium aquaticum]
MNSHPVRRSVLYITAHYIMTYLGYYGLVSTLVVTLSKAAFSAEQIAMLVILFTLTTKAAKIPLAPWLDRMAATSSVLIGCVMAAAGFVLLCAAKDFYLTACALTLSGTGISINALASKQLAAATSDMMENRAKLFSITYIGINIAAAAAAPLALYLVAKGQYQLVLIGIAVSYCIAGIVTFLNFKQLGMKHPGGGAPSFLAYWKLLYLPGIAPFLLINFFCWLLYGQLFNVLALYVSETLALPGKLGWLYSLNALLVIGLQLLVTHYAHRWSGGKPLGIVHSSYATFALAFIMPFILPGYIGALAFVLLFTFAEMMFAPSMDVLLLSLIGKESRAVGYSVLSISTALGESMGGGMGVAIYRWMANHGHASQFWLVLAGLSLLCIAIAYVLQTSSAGLRAQAAGAA